MCECSNAPHGLACMMPISFAHAGEAMTVGKSSASISPPPPRERSSSSSEALPAVAPSAFAKAVSFQARGRPSTAAR